MEEQDFITRVRRIIKMRHDDVVAAMVSGGVDNMETYKYIIGQINALESVKQELSALLEHKEQNDGTIVDIKDGKSKA